jgi:hypothetical protein
MTVSRANRGNDIQSSSECRILDSQNDYLGERVNHRIPAMAKENTKAYGPLIDAELVDLFIFRTNIKRKSDFARLKRRLEKKPGIHLCTIDLRDCDRVLRVKCENVTADDIVEEVQMDGFFCEELED